MQISACTSIEVHKTVIYYFSYFYSISFLILLIPICQKTLSSVKEVIGILLKFLLI